MDIQLDPDTASRLAELAQATHRTQGELASHLLKNCLNDLQRWQAEALLQGLREAEAGQLTDLKIVRQDCEGKRARQIDSKR